MPSISQVDSPSSSVLSPVPKDSRLLGEDQGGRVPTVCHRYKRQSQKPIIAPLGDWRLHYCWLLPTLGRCSPLCVHCIPLHPTASHCCNQTRQEGSTHCTHCLLGAHPPWLLPSRLPRPRLFLPTCQPKVTEPPKFRHLLLLLPLPFTAKYLTCTRPPPSP